MRLVTSRQMQRMDTESIQSIGIPSLVLMENAARSAAEIISSRFPDSFQIYVFCGSGNNGGDGYAIARNLKNRGFQVKTIEIHKPKSPDCTKNAEIWKAFGTSLTWDHFKSEFHAYSSKCLFVDAILGTGITRGVEGILGDQFNWINQQNKTVIAIDIASGINASSGDVSGAVIEADITVTFQVEKVGHHIHPGKKNSGEVICQKISIKETWQTDDIEYHLVNKAKAATLFPELHLTTYKNQQGHLGLLCGNYGTIGAALLASKAGIKSGCGLVTLSLPEKLCQNVPFWFPEIMTHPQEDVDQHWMEKFDAYVIGSGMGREPAKWTQILSNIKATTQPILLDADAFHGISNWDFLKQGNFVLTPHLGEFIRMSGYKPPDSNQEKIDQGRKFAQEFNTTLILKGAPSIVFSPEGSVFINGTGNPGMATAGTGDVLAGITGSFLAQGLRLLDAAILGNWLHGKSGDEAAARSSMTSLTASDLYENINHAVCSLNKTD